MSFLNRMYSRMQSKDAAQSDKNPNRVAGGLRAQGADHFEMLGEDGSVQKVPSQRYVQSLEEQIKKQRASIDVLERKLSRQGTEISQLQSAVLNRSR